MHSCCSQLYVKINIKKCGPFKTGPGPIIVQSRGPINPLEFWLDSNADTDILYIYIHMCVCVSVQPHVNSISSSWYTE